MICSKAGWEVFLKIIINESDGGETCLFGSLDVPLERENNDGTITEIFTEEQAENVLLDLYENNDLKTFIGEVNFASKYGIVIDKEIRMKIIKNTDTELIIRKTERYNEDARSNEGEEWSEEAIENEKLDYLIRNKGDGWI